MINNVMIVSDVQQSDSVIPVCVHAQLLQSCLTLCDPVDLACQAPPSVGLSRQEDLSGFPALLQGIFPIQRSNQRLLHLLHHGWIFYPPSSLGSPLVIPILFFSRFFSHLGCYIISSSDLSDLQ